MSAQIRGQFASEIRRCGYADRIVSVEPLSQAHSQLLQSSPGDSLWDAYPRCALGDLNGSRYQYWGEFSKQFHSEHDWKHIEMLHLNQRIRGSTQT